jgi:hypothetical protein
MSAPMNMVAAPLRDDSVGKRAMERSWKCGLRRRNSFVSTSASAAIPLPGSMSIGHYLAGGCSGLSTHFRAAGSCSGSSSQAGQT